MKKISFFGICGKMSLAMSKELIKNKDFLLVSGLDKINIGKDIGKILNIEKINSFIYDDYEEIKKTKPDLIIDFTGPKIVNKNIDWALNSEIDIIVGATGISEEAISKIKKKSLKARSKVFIVPNFSIGAVLMMKISKSVCKYFDNCEIIEMHHDQKKDAPSGTAIATAHLIGKEKKFNKNKFISDSEELLDGSRGGFADGIHIHSIRLPGFLAHQEVLFGTSGQVLKIRHDSIDRSSFYPGLLMAIKNIDSLDNFTYGLDSLIEI